MSAQVIHLRDPATGESRSLGFEQAWRMLPETMRRRSESRERLYGLWARACAMAGGESRLLSALDMYVRRDADLPKSGGPGLQVWLRQRRYDYWLEILDREAAAPIRQPKRFADETLRANFHERFADERARAWFDRCELDGDTLVGPTAKQEWIYGPFAKWAAANGIGGYRAQR